jgi:hypothetical protein
VSKNFFPVDLVVGATDEMDSTVTNMCRLIQSLDVDINPDNGINISAEIRDVVAGRSIDFSQSETDFENDPEIQDII